MTFVNVGARMNNSDIPTKKALKDVIASFPYKVVFYTTSAMEPSETVTADELDTTVNYTVVGPNPYNNRKWYATVTRDNSGKITVK